jgi:uncharacterized protein YbaR (Trm112 family)
MIDSELLKILCCPETHQELRWAEPGILENLNAQIAAGALKNRSGKQLSERLESGLIRADGKFLYPVRRDIPVMLIDEAIPVT